MQQYSWDTMPTLSVVTRWTQKGHTGGGRSRWRRTIYGDARHRGHWHIGVLVIRQSMAKTIAT